MPISLHQAVCFTELKVKCSKSGRTRKSKWVQYGKCARKVYKDILLPVSSKPSLMTRFTTAISIFTAAATFTTA